VQKANERLNSGLGHKILGSANVKAFAKTVDALFHGRIIDASIGRVIGSRASAGVVVCDGDGEGNMTLVQLVFNAKRPFPYRVSAHTVPVVIQRHALARLMQRITGESSLPKVISTIQPHLHKVLLWAIANNPLEPRSEVSVTGLGLELSGSVDEHGLLRLKTAIDAPTMQSSLRQAWAMSDKVEIRETYHPLTGPAKSATI
jgi:hypothetical protein